MTRTQIANEILSKRNVSCDCYAPADGYDDHAPDCALVLAEDRAWATAGEILYERDEV